MLGGAQAAHDVVSSQKAVKAYIDTEISALQAKYDIQPITSNNASFSFVNPGPSYFVSYISSGITSVTLDISSQRSSTNYILFVNEGQQQVNVSIHRIVLNGSAVDKSYYPVLLVEAKSASLLTIHTGSNSSTSFAIIEQAYNLLLH